MRELLAYRAWFDQRKGWRFNNPNLEQLGLVEVEYLGLKELTEKEAAFAGAPALLAAATPAARFIATAFFDSIEFNDFWRRVSPTQPS